MITKIQMSPNLGAFHARISINSWEIPGRKLFIHPQCLITQFLVDDKDGFFMPKKGAPLDLYHLPAGHRYELCYQISIDPKIQWFFIRDDGKYLPVFGEDRPPLRYTEIILPEDFVALSTHELEKVQHKEGLLRFVFRGEDGPVISIARYYVERIFSGEIYLLDEKTDVELLSRVLRRAWEAMRSLYGDGAFSGPLRYAVLTPGEEAFQLDNTFFFPWPEKGSLRGFEGILRAYLSAGWAVLADEAQSFFHEGFLLFYLSKMINHLYSPRELESFHKEFKPLREALTGKSLQELTGRDLSIGGWMLLEDLEAFLNPEIFYPVMKLFIHKHRETPADLDAFLSCFEGLSWKEGTREFLVPRLFGGAR